MTNTKMKKLGIVKPIARGNWDRDTGNYTIHCTDGDIPKSA